MSLSSSVCASFSCHFCSFFSFFSCCNWLSHKVKVINAVLSLVASASDSEWHSPNYHKRTPPCWPMIASHSMWLCLSTHIYGHTHMHMDLRWKDHRKQHEMFSAHTVSWRPPIICHDDSITKTIFINSTTICLGFNWESEQVLAVHQIGGLDAYFKWSDMNSRGSPQWLCCAY